MPALAFAAKEKLQELEAVHRRRTLKASTRAQSPIILRDGKSYISFSCNDTLGLSQHPAVKAAAIAATEAYGAGAGASRLVTGNHPLYAELEEKLASWKGTEAALVFGSGYLANIGVIPALVGKGDCIIADKLSHACILDGAQLSGARLLRFRHNDVEDCAQLLKGERGKYRHCLIVTEEVFSMDGDRAPLAGLAGLASQYDAWLMADGAHSVSGTTAKADVYIGTLSKALGSYGGYVGASREVIDYLATSARSLMFSTGLPPAALAAASAALDIIRTQPELAALPLARARQFTQATALPEAQSSIVPLVLGEEQRALDAASMLEQTGYLVTPIRPPTVPAGTSRLRFAFSAAHTEDNVHELADVIKKENWV